VIVKLSCDYDDAMVAETNVHAAQYDGTHDSEQSSARRLAYRFDDTAGAEARQFAALLMMSGRVTGVTFT
jgi:hypothetical protein